ncbi:PQQ-binding-like beta-propeller repeat protein [Deinococcus sp.]|uniref:outer membrane protein assembly factor BamB family protein n=1 Tax=Deinococcus sp. TaxID=47478 RepID=UPI003B5CF8BB
MTLTRFLTLTLLSTSLGGMALAQSSAPSAAMQDTASMNTQASSSTGINAQNVAGLKLSWSFAPGAEVSATPLTDGNSVFVADWDGNAYAINAKTGRPLWTTKLQTSMKMWPWHGFAGTGALTDKAYIVASAEGYAFALDKQSGKVLWKTDFAPNDQYAGSISHLLVNPADGLVYIGVSSVSEPVSEMMEKMGKAFKPTSRGRVVALNTSTGNTAWEKYLTDPDKNGTSMWSSFALDKATDTLFFTTGNSYSGTPGNMEDAMVAANARSGEIKWVTQTFKDDVWLPVSPDGPDYDFGAGPQLFEASIGGQVKQLVGGGSKSGIYWAFDRQTGAVVWKTVIGYGAKGGGIDSEASVGPDGLYVWSNNSYTYDLDPVTHPITIKALDLATGTAQWTRPKVQPAGTTSAGFLANDVYLVGTLDGKIRAYRSSDGQNIWTSPAHGSISAPLSVVGNTLYFSSGLPSKFGMGKGVVFAYTLK